MTDETTSQFTQVSAPEGDQPTATRSQPSAKQSQSTAPNLTQSIDFIAKATASVLLFVYGVGFVILGFHDARYGVVQFSPFRERIVLVGLVFTGLVGLPVLALNARIAYWSILKNVQRDEAEERYWQKEFVLMCGFIFSANIIGQLLGAFMFASVHAERVPLWRWGVWCVTIFILEWVFHYVDKIFSSQPRKAGVIAIGAVIFYMAGLGVLFSSAPWAQLVFFFVLVGLQAGLLRATRDVRKHFTSILSWINVFMLVWTYITQVFSILPPRWGGGQLTPVQLFLSNAVPWSPANPIDAQMLDETDQGMYVLLSPTGKAFFVPRSNIASVYFGSRTDLPVPKPQTGLPHIGPEE